MYSKTQTIRFKKIIVKIRKKMLRTLKEANKYKSEISKLLMGKYEVFSIYTERFKDNEYLICIGTKNKNYIDQIKSTLINSNIDMKKLIIK